ncbi:MAG: acetyl-CoA carboxylase, carboxyltransferase subunit beta [Bacteroidia bacterium]|jgi:acetyl-CoA carboxylase carboxyl transferase subunit beta|nr:acetyl-CoA carboxylase, carboxyltransferase subunit beta [Bacteroidia bacterium]
MTEEEKWYKRKLSGILTKTKDKKSTPDGLWEKCKECKTLVPAKDWIRNLYVCPECNYHERIGSREYFNLLFEKGKYTELALGLSSGDPLGFVDSAPYKDRVQVAQAKTGLDDACRTATGKLGENRVVVSCMDFSFIGGSMGSVVGEKIARGIDYSLEHELPFIMISKSGGARMMEAAFSLMQMAKTSAKLALLNKAKLPYISILTHPTTGGVTASFAMLGDFNIAEPKALIGFAGPRVIKETIGRDLPKGFQSSEFLVEHGFLDFIVDRNDIKNKLNTLIKLIKQKKK